MHLQVSLQQCHHKHRGRGIREPLKPCRAVSGAKLYERSNVLVKMPWWVSLHGCSSWSLFFFFFGTFVDLLSDLVQRVACKPTYGVFPQHIFAHCAAALVSVVVRLVVCLPTLISVQRHFSQSNLLSSAGPVCAPSQSSSFVSLNFPGSQKPHAFTHPQTLTKQRDPF
jgi:hypothetical protein